MRVNKVSGGSRPWPHRPQLTVEANHRPSPTPEVVQSDPFVRCVSVLAGVRTRSAGSPRRNVCASSETIGIVPPVPPMTASCSKAEASARRAAATPAPSPAATHGQPAAHSSEPQADARNGEPGEMFAEHALYALRRLVRYQPEAHLCHRGRRDDRFGPFSDVPADQSIDIARRTQPQALQGRVAFLADQGPDTNLRPEPSRVEWEPGDLLTPGRQRLTDIP